MSASANRQTPPVLPPDFRLRIDAHALVQLGEQLITDDEQALLELVKNSYDADADWAKIRIVSDYVPNPETDHVPREAVGLIEIEDNGMGMDQAGIERGWLLISLSLKRKQKAEGKRTPKHRRLPLGDKGLGRLGTMKLGKCLSVETRNSPSEEGWLVTFQWSDIQSGTLLENVPIHWIRIPANGQTGTTVRVLGLRELKSWRTSKREKRLEVKLSGLISPFEPKESFDVTLSLDGREIGLASIGPRLRETAAMTFNYDWDGQRLEISGKVKLIWFRKKKNGYDEFIARDEGKALFKALEDNHLLSGEFQLSRSSDPSWFVTVSKRIAVADIPLANNGGVNPGPFNGSLDYFDLDTDIQLPKGVFSGAADYRDQVKNLAQIYVYRDGFGIRMPNDWLRLGAAWTSEAGYYSLKPSNVIGFFRISVGGNSDLIEKSDREGFTENDAWRGFFALTNIITNSLNRALNRLGRTSTVFLNEVTGLHATEEESATNYGELLTQLEDLLGTAETTGQHFDRHAKSRLYGLRKVEGPTRMLFLDRKNSEEARTKAKELLGIIEQLQAEFATDDEQVGRLTKQLAEQRKLAAIIRRRIDDFQDRAQLLYEMVGVGLSAQALAHDVPAMLHHLHDQARALIKHSKVRPYADVDKIIVTSEELKTSISALEQMIDFVRPMLRGRRLSRRRAMISEFVRSFFELRGARLLTRGINWHLETEGLRDFEISFNPGRFTQVLDNLTTNSEYWIAQHLGVENKQGRISLEIRDPELIFYDNGKGIRPDLEASLFEMFASGKEGDEGNGLGLFITRQLLLRDNCTIAVDNTRNEHKRLYQFVINFAGAKK